MYGVYVNSVRTLCMCTYTSSINTLPHNHQPHIEMECIEVLPAPEDVIHPTIIPLFGILMENTAEPGQCYFCFRQIDGKELLAMTMQCCQQKAHCRCFQMWGCNTTAQPSEPYGAGIAEHHSRTRNSVTCAFRIKTTDKN